MSSLHETILPNGLQVLTKELHHAPVVSVMLWYRVGSRLERQGGTGLSHFLEHMMFKGTDHYPKGAIDAITVRHGGTNNAFTSYDFTAYYFTFASDRWEQALDIEASRMTNCLFDPLEFAAEKQVILEEWRMYQDSPWDPLMDLVMSTAFLVHPYRHPVLGWYPELERLTPEQMREHYRRWYVPNNATLVVVGDFDTQEALAKIERTFGHLAPAPVPEVKYMQEPEQEGERRVQLHHSGQVPRLAIAYRVPEAFHADTAALALLEAILGQGRSSRLHQYLFEELQLVNDVGIMRSTAKDPHVMTLLAELKPDGDLVEVEREIDRVLESVRDHGVTAEELAKAKNMVTSSLFFEEESALNLAIRYGESASLGRWQWADEIVAAIQAVTQQDVQQVAERYLRPHRRTVGWQIPQSLISQSEAAMLPEAEATEDDGLLEAPQDGPLPPLPAPLALRPVKFEVPPVRTFKLANGLTVLVWENPATPTVAIKALVNAGARFDPPLKAGVATLTGRTLYKGAGLRQARQIAEEIEFVGGMLESSTGLSATSVSCRTLSRDLGLGLEILLDGLQKPHFLEDEVIKEKEALLGDLAASDEEPKVVAKRAFFAGVYGEHPAGRPPEGTQETVATIERSDLVAFHQAYFRPDNVVLSVVGHVSAEAVVAEVEKWAGNWQAEPTVRPVIAEPVRQTTGQRQHIHRDKAQVSIYLGHLGVRRLDPDLPALEVMDAILGNSPGFTARIPAHLRDGQGLAYTVYSDITGTAGQEPGVFQAFIGTEPARMEAAIQGLMDEVRLMRAEGVSETELAEAKAYLTGSVAMQLETNPQKADYLLRCHVYGWGFDEINHYVDRILAVTQEDVLQVARRHLHPDAMTVVAVGAVSCTH